MFLHHNIIKRSSGLVLKYAKLTRSSADICLAPSQGTHGRRERRSSVPVTYAVSLYVRICKRSRKNKWVTLLPRNTIRNAEETLPGYDVCRSC